MKRIVRLTESDLARIVRRVIQEQEVSEFIFDFSDKAEPYKEPSKKEKMMVQRFTYEIKEKLDTGGGDWQIHVPNPRLKDLISGIRRVCDKYESLV